MVLKETSLLIRFKSLMNYKKSGTYLRGKMVSAFATNHFNLNFFFTIKMNFYSFELLSNKSKFDNKKFSVE